MNPQVLSAVRSLLKVGGGAMTALGWVDEGVWTEVSGAILVLIGFGWSFYEHKGS